jgi:hypothetical protein
MLSLRGGTTKQTPHKSVKSSKIIGEITCYPCNQKLNRCNQNEHEVER